MNVGVRYFLKPYRRRFLLVGTVMVVGSFLEGFTIAAFFPVLLAIVQPGDPAQMPRVLRAMVDVTRMLPWADPVVSASALLSAALLVRTVVLFGRDALIASTGGRILYDLKRRLMKEYAGLPYQFFTAQKQGTLLYQAVVAPGHVAMTLQRVPQCAAEILKILAIALVLLATFPAATALFALFGMIYFAGARRLSTTLAYDTGTGRSAAYAEQMEVAQQLFSGIRHLRAYRVESHWLSAFDKANRLYRQLYTRYLTWLALPRNVMELAAVLLLLGAIAFGRLTRADSFALWLPALGLFALATMQLMPALTALGRMVMEIQEAKPDVERLHGVMTQPRPSPREGTRAFAGLKSEITLDRLSFRYEGRQEVLHDLSLTLPQGRVTAISGQSGVGKTTIVNLLLGLIEPTAGTIVVDGTPLQSYEPASWLRHVGFVSQDPFVFHGTVAGNIRFGRTGFSDADVVSAARVAHAHQFITEMPGGYDTVVGDRGAKLSGGQQQRLAIARAVLGDPDILVLDEPTSALDHASRQLVQEALFDASANRTVIMVTHDEKAVAIADHVVTLTPYRSEPELAGAVGAVGPGNGDTGR